MVTVDCVKDRIKLTNSIRFAYSSEIRYNKNEFDEGNGQKEFRQPLFGMDHHFFLHRFR